MADPREITATLVVNFSTGAVGGDGLVAEVDSRPDGLNGGKTSFVPGDDVYILVYKTTNVTLNTPVSSHGAVIYQAGLSPVAIEKTDDLQFVDEITADLRYPIPLSGFTGAWLGNNLGNVTARSETTVGITQPVDAHFAGVYRVSWSPEALVYRLTNTALTGYTEYPIVVHFTGIAV
jgi:hypothetical protein